MTSTGHVGHVGDVRPRDDDGALPPSPERDPTTHHRYQGARSSVDPFQRVLSIRARVERQDVPSFVHDALTEIRVYIEEHHVDVEGPPFSLSRPAWGHGLDVEVGWPVGVAFAGAGRVACRDLPAGLVRRGWDHT